MIKFNDIQILKKCAFADAKLWSCYLSINWRVLKLIATSYISVYLYTNNYFTVYTKLVHKCLFFLKWKFRTGISICWEKDGVQYRLFAHINLNIVCYLKKPICFISMAIYNWFKYKYLCFIILSEFFFFPS